MGYRCRVCGVHFPGSPAAVHEDGVPNKYCESCYQRFQPSKLRYLRPEPAEEQGE